MKINKKIIKFILNLRNEDEINEFFLTLFSEKEIDQIQKRLEIIELLYNNNDYIDIIRRTGTSSATISKLNNKLKYKSDKLKKVLERISKKKTDE